MTWTDPLLTEGDSWHGVGFLNDIVRAINERREAGGAGSAITGVVEGDIVQGVSFLAGLQLAAITVLQAFQDPDTMDVTPGAIPANFTDVSDWAGTRYTAQTAMDAAGLSDGFTRKRPREIEDLDDDGEDGQVARFVGPSADSLIYTHDGDDWTLASDQSLKPDVIDADSDFPRYIEAGDYIGPWIFNELQDLLQVASVVVYGSFGLLSVADVTDATDTLREASSGGRHTTAALAKAATDADWPGGESTGFSVTPAKFSSIDFHFTAGYRAWAFARDRCYSNTRQTGDYSYTQTAEIVALPLAYGSFGSTYEDFGQGMVEDDLFLFDSGDFNDGDELVVGGSTSQPTWEDDSDGVEGWGWTVGTDLQYRPTIVTVFTWEFQ